jgi:hypothetical protein
MIEESGRLAGAGPKLVAAPLLKGFVNPVRPKLLLHESPHAGKRLEALPKTAGFPFLALSLTGDDPSAQDCLSGSQKISRPLVIPGISN